MRRQPIAVDFETFLITPGNPMPPTVCLSADTGMGKPQLLDREKGVLYLLDLLKDPDVLVVGANTAYDLGVALADAARLWSADAFPIIFEALDNARVHDVQTRQKIIDLGLGHLGFSEDRQPTTYSLDQLSQRWTGVKLDKDEDGWRMRYGELAGVPLEQWDKRATDYALGDTAATRAVWVGQQFKHGGARQPEDLGEAPGIVMEAEQMRADFALHLMSSWGMRTNPVSVEALARRQDKIILEVAQELSGRGWLDGASKKTKAIQEAVREDWAGRSELRHMPMTEEGDAPSLAAENLRLCSSPGLRRLADLVEAAWVKSNPVPLLRKGAEAALNPRYNFLKTGRMSSSKPALGNLSKSGGIRECFEPRPGYAYLDADFGTLELCTFAQDLFELFGQTSMVTALQEKRDLHVDLAALMLGIDYATACAWRRHEGTPEQFKLIKANRQIAKAPNFGIPGGMGAAGLQVYAAGMGISMSMQEAERVLAYYNQRWPEVPRQYFPMIKQACGPSGWGAFTHPISGLRDGHADFTSMCNGRFQGRAALGAKRATYEVSYRCHVKRDSALYGSHPVNFVHDELLLETPEEMVHEAGLELATVMTEQMQTVCPNIPISVTAVAMRKWLKDAEPRFNKHGRLIPFEDAE